MGCQKSLHPYWSRRQIMLNSKAIFLFCHFPVEWHTGATSLLILGPLTG